MVYKQTEKNQNWLLPLSIKEMISADHVCFLVEDFGRKIDVKCKYPEKMKFSLGSSGMDCNQLLYGCLWIAWSEN